MRDFLNAILAFISAESLTDVEFDSVEASVASYSQSTYDDLARILLEREAVSSVQERLTFYYKARGVSVTEADTASSNIYIGSVLE